MDSVGLEVERFFSPRIESNMKHAERGEKNSVDESLPIEDILVLECFLDGCKVRIIKDDV